MKSSTLSLFTLPLFRTQYIKISLKIQVIYHCCMASLPPHFSTLHTKEDFPIPVLQPCLVLHNVPQHSWLLMERQGIGSYSLTFPSMMLKLFHHYSFHTKSSEVSSNGPVYHRVFCRAVCTNTHISIMHHVRST